MEDLEKVVKKIKNQKAKEWRDKNKDKIKAINKRYWEKKAREYIAKEKGE